MNRRASPSDGSDEVYAFLVSYLVLKPEDAAQRKHPLREVLNALIWVARTGAQWDYLPHHFPPPDVVRSQAARWFAAGCFENAVHDLRLMLREQQQRHPEPSAVILDRRTLQSTPESGQRAGFDGAKKRKGTKVHLAVDTLGHLLTVLASPANEQDRAQVQDLCLGYTGEEATTQASAANVSLIVVKRPEAAKGFILLPKRWVVERSFAWFSRFRRLARDLERLPSTLLGFHFLAACMLMTSKLPA